MSNDNSQLPPPSPRPATIPTSSEVVAHLGAPAASPAPTAPVAPAAHHTVNVNVGQTPGYRKAPGAGSLLLNLIWLFFAGLWLFLFYLFAGVLQCLTVIGIPFGVQSFKLAGFALWPFGRSVVYRPGASTSLSLVGNLIWLVLSGIWLALAHLVIGVFLCLTVIGIPLGLGNFKLIPLALTPFGKDIVRNDAVTGPTVVSF
jgi:uncharacterized membrane protein YccF (DUF307 family)